MSVFDPKRAIAPGSGSFEVILPVAEAIGEQAGRKEPDRRSCFTPCPASRLVWSIDRLAPPQENGGALSHPAA